MCDCCCCAVVYMGQSVNESAHLTEGGVSQTGREGGGVERRLERRDYLPPAIFFFFATAGPNEKMHSAQGIYSSLIL